MSTDEPHDALPDLPVRKPPSRRDPFDTDLLTMHDQALSIVVQLRRVPKVRAALPAVHHDADQLADQLYAVAKEADLRRMRAKQAHTTLRWRRGLSAELVSEARDWLALVRLAMKAVSGVPAVATVRAAAARPRRTCPTCRDALFEVLRALDEAGLATHPQVAAAYAAGGPLLKRLEAHLEALRLDAREDHEVSRINGEARSALLAELRRVRTLWETAARLTPDGLQPLDLRLVLANRAVRSPAPPVPEGETGPTDGVADGVADGLADGGVDGLAGGGALPPAEPGGDPGELGPACEADDRAQWVRIEVRQQD
jgi:hypothetical protein